MEIVLISLLAVFFLIIFFIAYTDHVRQKGYFLHQMKDLNHVWVIRGIKRKQQAARYYSNKTTYQNANVTTLTKEHLKENIPFYEQQIGWAKTNRTKYEGYTQAFVNVLTTQKQSPTRRVDGKKASWLFKVVERMILNTTKLKPVMAFNLFSFAQYTSAKGRVSERKWMDYPFESVIQLLQEAKQERAHEQSRIGQMKKERSRLSASLRYDVLARDQFTCQICGRSQNDGVKLHVDHIYPIAKGGKTEINNLRALCDRCNLGKKDKIEALT